MKTRNLIGIIVPVYKVEIYIAECIESILAQTYTNFRLILIDDGSPDNAGKICDEYAKKDSRITVIHQENAGVTHARARGVEEAEDCEFITFVDGDDTIIRNAIEILVSKVSSKYDIVITHFKGYTYPQKESISINEYRHFIISGDTLSCGPCSKLYRKSLFNNFCFDIPSKIIYGEDLIMNIRIAFRTQKEIAITPVIIYNYRILSESAFHSFKNSLTYQEEYFKILEQSLPKELYKEFLPSITLRALNNWRLFYLYSPQKVKKEDFAFIKRLKTYISKSNYKLNLFDKIQLYCPIRLIRLISINIHKAFNIIERLNRKCIFNQ